MVGLVAGLRPTSTEPTTLGIAESPKTIASQRSGPPNISVMVLPAIPYRGCTCQPADAAASRRSFDVAGARSAEPLTNGMVSFLLCQLPPEIAQATRGIARSEDSVRCGVRDPSRSEGPAHVLMTILAAWRWSSMHFGSLWVPWAVQPICGDSSRSAGSLVDRSRWHAAAQVSFGCFGPT